MYGDDKKFEVGLYSGAGVELSVFGVTARSAEDALDQVVAYIVNNGLKGLYITEDDILREAEFYKDDEQSVEDWIDNQDMYLYVDATMADAPYPVYVDDTNLTIKEVDKYHDYTTVIDDSLDEGCGKRIKEGCGKKIKEDVARPTTTTTYHNKRNPNKHIEIHNDGYGHNTIRQYMKYTADDLRKIHPNIEPYSNEPLINMTGDGKLYRWRKKNREELLQDYELDENKPIGKKRTSRMTEGYFYVIKDTPEFKSLQRKIYFDLCNKDDSLSKTIQNVVKGLGGSCRFEPYSHSAQVEGSLGDYTFLNYISFGEYLDADLNRFAEDLAMGVLKNQGFMLNESRRPRRRMQERFMSKRPIVRRNRRR